MSCSYDPDWDESQADSIIQSMRRESAANRLKRAGYKVESDGSYSGPYGGGGYIDENGNIHSNM